MLTEIPRFHRRARGCWLRRSRQARPSDGDVTLRDFLAAGRFSAYFHRHFMEPLVAAVWSCDPEVALDYPARYLFTFLEHHGMLGVFGSPTVAHRHRRLRRVRRAWRARLHEVRAGTKVTSVLETADGVEVTDGNGAVHLYDAVVIATHPGQALAMLAEPTAAQREVLAAMPYSHNTALLHTDTSLLPRPPRAWASWNFRRPRAATGPVTVTYDLTRLQRLDTDTHYLVTLGGEDLVDPATVIDRMEYEHPLYNPGSVAAQAPAARDRHRPDRFAGAYHGWGFHEDGARSGLAAAERLGLTWPAVLPRSPADDVPTGTLRDHDPAHPPDAVPTHLHPPLAHLAGRPRRPARPRRARPVRGARPPRQARPVDPRQRRRLPRRPRRRPRRRAGPDGRARARVRLLLQPDQRLLVLRRRRRPAAAVVEVHNTYGDRHAYLVHPDEQGRATHRQGDVRLAVPRHRRPYELAVPGPPGDRLDVAVTLHTDDGAGSARR